MLLDSLCKYNSSLFLLLRLFLVVRKLKRFMVMVLRILSYCRLFVSDPINCFFVIYLFIFQRPFFSNVSSIIRTTSWREMQSPCHTFSGSYTKIFLRGCKARIIIEVLRRSNQKFQYHALSKFLPNICRFWQIFDILI